jgi:hypothetical protein
MRRVIFENEDLKYIAEINIRWSLKSSGMLRLVAWLVYRPMYIRFVSPSSGRRHYLDQLMWRHIAEHLNLHARHCEYIKTRIHVGLASLSAQHRNVYLRAACTLCDTSAVWRGPSVILSYVSGCDSREQHPPVAGSQDKSSAVWVSCSPHRSTFVSCSNLSSVI